MTLLCKFGTDHDCYITTNSKNTLQPAPDLFKRHFTVNDVNKAWVSDTTFIAMREGWLYLAIILDFVLRQVIGCSTGAKNDTALVQDALAMAIWRRRQVKDIIVHSNQGSTYASGSYRQQLLVNNLHYSMSRKGECLDNAVAESFFGALKNELVYHENIKQECKQTEHL